MHRQLAAVHIIRLFAQEVEQLGVAQADEEVEAVVCVAHDQKKGGLSIAQGVQVQFVHCRQVTQLLNIKGCKSSATGDEDGLGSLSSCQLVFLILPDSEVLGFFLLQRFEHHIHCVFEALVVLPDLHGVDELNQGAEVLFLNGRFVVDVADEGGVEQGLCLHPEIIPGLAIALGVGYQGGYQLQDVLLAVDVSEGVVAHGFLEVDGVEDADAITKMLQHPAALHHHAPFRVGHDKAHRVGLGHALHQVGLEPESGLARA